MFTFQNSGAEMTFNSIVCKQFCILYHCVGHVLFVFDIAGTTTFTVVVGSRHAYVCASFR